METIAAAAMITARSMPQIRSARPPMAPPTNPPANANAIPATTLKQQNSAPPEHAGPPLPGKTTGPSPGKDQIAKHYRCNGSNYI
jgi:hypothetical protein